MLNLHHLRLFRAVAREGQLTAAAKQLNISQSAVSTQIRQLEATLGHDLFERVGRRLELTEAGRIALDHADEIFRAADDLGATLAATGGGRIPLRIGALATLSRNFQIAFIEPIIGREDVSVILRSGAQEVLLQALGRLTLDVVLTNLVPPRDREHPYLVHRLAEQPVSLVGEPDRFVRTDLKSLLTANPLILPTPESSLRAGFDALLDGMEIVPRVAAEADDMAMLRLLARSGTGIAVIPPIVVQDELANGTLVELARLDALSEVFFAVTLPRRFPHPALAEVLPSSPEPD